MKKLDAIDDLLGQLPITIESQHMPPSTNNLFANIPGKGRVRSSAYNGWLNAAGWDCKRKGTMHGPFTLSLVLSRAHRRKGSDIDNKIKPVLDLLVKHQIIEDDSLCERVTASWGDPDGVVGWRAEVWPVDVRS